MRDTYEPKILAFLCNWCSYPSSDLAGTTRLQYPSNIRPLRVMCSGRVDPQFIIRAFLAGFEAVMVLGCHPGDCHYQNGNFYAVKKIKMVNKLLDLIRVNPERLYLEWVSAPEATLFAQIVKDYTSKIKSLGPLKRDEKLLLRLKAAERTVTSEKVRTIVAKQLPLETTGNVYREKLSEDETNRVLYSALRETYKEMLILQTIKESSLSPVDIASQIGINTRDVAFYLAAMWNRGKVRMDGVKGDYPLFIGT